MLTGKVTAVPKSYRTWRYPIIKAWKKMFGCHGNHLFLVTDYYEVDEEGNESYRWSDFQCDACGSTIGGPG